MRHLLYFLCVMGMWATSVAQNLQNANWIFGGNTTTLANRASFTATTSSFGSVSASFNTNEGCASVSDYYSGQLLLFSDGVRVFQPAGSTYNIVANDLKGHFSSAQNVLIIPKPNNPTRYYIVTIAGATSNYLGLYYSEIDLSGSSAVFLSKNIPLRDDLQNVIDNSYGNASEAITVAPHSDGVNYWLISQVHGSSISGLQGRVLSYLVSENGIGISNPSPNMPSSALVHHTVGYALSLKVSPSNNKIALGKSITPSYYGTFNPTTGSVSLPYEITGSRGFGIEFSPNSNVLYISNGENLNPIFRKFNCTSTTSSPSLIHSTTELAYGLQRAMNGRIYCARGLSTSSVGVISNPDLTGFLTTTSQSVITPSRLGLPQWVPQWEPPQCTPLVKQTTEPAGNILYSNRTTIHANTAYTVNNSSTNVTMQASEYIVFGPNSLLTNGTLWARIVPCFALRQNALTESELPTDLEIKENPIPENRISVEPNPANSIIAIRASEPIVQFAISRISDGRVVQAQKVKPATQVEADVSALPKGLYILTAETESGKKLTDKIIKN